MAEISRRTRFNVFKRDAFTCQYCGRKPPAVVLHLDHVIPLHPRSEGITQGTHEEDNLITACEECNQGKSNVPLDQIAPGIDRRLAVLQEKEEQLTEYNKYLRRQKSRLKRDADKIDEIFRDTFKGYQLSESFRRVSLKKFLDMLPAPEVEDAMRLAVERIRDRNNALRYFCGICWKKIKNPD